MPRHPKKSKLKKRPTGPRKPTAGPRTVAPVAPPPALRLGPGDPAAFAVARSKAAELAEAHREAMARRSREQSDAVADIGQIPDVLNPARREACRLDLHKFLITYFPASTGKKPFSEDHIHAIACLQRCILDGGLFVEAFPRGFAKTTISENSTIWAVIYGHRKFVPIFGADAKAAAGNIDSIQLELSENDLLNEDFPEVCHAIRALEGKAQRCASQTHDGTLTHIEYKAEMIVLPTIKGSVAGGAVVTARGILGGCRGMKHKRPDGTQQRPDFVILDDPQTDESANTALQVNKRLDIIRKSILKLGGHDRKIAAVMNATVIKQGDLVEQLLDPKRFPNWQGQRIQMVKKWAKAHETLWLTDYKKLRETYDPEQLGDQQRAHRAATEFYRRNRRKMDAGCQVSWEHCFNEETELGAIQHAYNLFIDDGPDVFASECQNEPLAQVDANHEAATADEIAEKLNGLKRAVIPAAATHLVAFIDVMQNVLYWGVLAVTDAFDGFVVDYGTFPDQKGRKYFAASEVRSTLEKVTGGKSLEECIYAGLDALVGNLMARDWVRDDGAILKPERILIDANWGKCRDLVYLFCRQSPHAAVLLPSHGKFVGASSRPLNDCQKKIGDRSGTNWRMPGAKGRTQTRHVVFDANYWKSFVQGRLRVGMGGRSCWSLWGDDAEEHRLFADHVTAEVGIEVEAKGRRVVEWKERPGRPDNHYLDCLVGCGVAASVQGVSMRELSAAPRVHKRIKLSDLQKAKANK